MRSVYLQRNKNIFKATELPTEEYAASLGLAGVPKIKFLSKAKAKETAVSRLLKENDKEEEEEEEEEKTKVKRKSITINNMNFCYRFGLLES